MTNTPGPHPPATPDPADPASEGPGAEVHTEIGGTVELGDDSDCETCGYTYNHLEWFYDPGTDLIEARTSVGCYGGEAITPTKDPAIALAFMNQVAEQWPEAARDIHAETASLLSQVTRARA